MSARPTDWSPLRSSDPVPGEPDAVHREAAYYGDVAHELAAQVRRLRAVGSDTTLEGDYAERVRTAAQELVGDLEKVESRFSAVASALRGWSGPLRRAQDDADRVLRRAKAAAASQTANAQTGALPSTATPEQVSADQRRQASHDAAGEELMRLEEELQGIEDERDDDASRVKRQIEDAIDDDIKDGRFDGVKQWASKAWKSVDAFVTEHAALLKKIAEVLSYVALAFAVLALCFTGVGLLALLAVGFTAAAATTRLALASTGNGSWADFALEAFALATFGVGKLAAKGIKGAHALQATRAASTARAARASTQARRVQLANQLGRRSLAPAARTAARRELDQLKRVADANRRLMRPRHPERIPVTTADVIRAGGEADSARYVFDMNRLRHALPSLPVAGQGSLHLARGAFGLGVGVDSADKVLGASDVLPGKPSVAGYDELKGRSTVR